MNNDNWVWNVIYKGELLGQTTTKERHNFLKEKLTEEQITDLEAGDIEFNLDKVVE